MSKLKYFNNLFGFSCKVPECEFGLSNRQLPFNRSWLSDAIPSKDGKFDNCHRYAPMNFNKSEEPHQCTADMFNTSMKIACSEFIYASDEKNVQTEVKLCCKSYPLQNHMKAYFLNYHQTKTNFD